jgi:hypothetical protein
MIGLFITLGAILALFGGVWYWTSCVFVWCEGAVASDINRLMVQTSVIPNPYGIFTSWAFARGVSHHDREAARKAKHVAVNMKRA